MAAEQTAGDDAQREYEANASPFVERFAADLTEAGMQRMAARVFACLLASDDGALTSAELSERLQISPAAVSGAVRYLSQVRMVSRQRSPGSRREIYLLRQDVWFAAMTDREPLINRWTATLDSGVSSLGEDTPGGRRLQETTDFLRFLQGELQGILKRWNEQRAGTGGDTGAPDSTTNPAPSP
ncbi:GbsR/MarR family transcriptional regulator [Streptomyces sp. NPDC048172]|uniref:GbsR/MarR family transcriptional regulator n=1 Tax=Streptomyces sp. NPDC048172 TaxID=3365505 RepID=UPI003723669F